METYTKSNITTKEVKNTLFCESLGITPKVVSYGEDFVELEKYPCSYSEYVAEHGYNNTIHKQVIELLLVLHNLGYWHGDDSEDNVVVRILEDGTFDVKLIDFCSLEHLASANDARIARLCEGCDLDECSVDALFKFELRPWKLA